MELFLSKIASRKRLPTALHNGKASRFSLARARFYCVIADAREGLLLDTEFCAVSVNLSLDSRTFREEVGVLGNLRPCLLAGLCTVQAEVGSVVLVDQLLLVVVRPQVAQDGLCNLVA